MDSFILGAAAVLGSIFGSFYNVVIYRLPRGKSPARGRSFCPHCRRTISWYDNIPLASYLVLRGRCRKCGEHISFSYFLVELLSSLIAVLVVIRFGLSPTAAFSYFFLSVLLIVAFIDWFHKIIPDVLSLGGVIMGWIASFFYRDTSLVESMIGSLAGAGILIAIAALYKLVRKVDGLGGGDVKLMAMIGAFLGWQMVLPVLFIASFMGSLYGIFLMRSGSGGKTAVAFGTFLSPAAFIVFWFGRRLWELYLGFYIR
jgi:leader peptidase (prepilin peptidase)/N-methyltransferase